MLGLLYGTIEEHVCFTEEIWIFWLTVSCINIQHDLCVHVDSIAAESRQKYAGFKINFTAKHGVAYIKRTRTNISYMACFINPILVLNKAGHAVADHISIIPCGASVGHPYTHWWVLQAFLHNPLMMKWNQIHQFTQSIHIDKMWQELCFHCSKSMVLQCY